MESRERIEILKGIDLFRSFSDEELRLFAENILEISLDTGETLFEEGEFGRDMYVLLEGSLKVFKERRTITVIEAVDYIGEMAIIEKKPRSATVTAISPVVLLKITLDQFNKYLSSQPKSLVSMMKTLSQRIRTDTELLAREFEKANILIHDMRNRLSAFLLLDMLKNNTPPETSQKYLRIMRNSKQDLSAMMEEALANAKRLKYHRPLNKNSLYRLICDLLNSEFAIHPDLKDKEIQTDLDPGVPEFPFYPIDIRRVLTNLVINAGQASAPGAIIRITLSQDGQQAVVVIKDHGSGIPETIHEKVFLPHFTTKPNGNGLGLASCRQIIENKHSGTLEFISTPEQGTCFTIKLPMHSAPENG